MSRVLIAFIGFVFCQTLAKASIDVDLNIYQYFQDEDPYIELNMHILGASLKSKDLDNTSFQTKARVLIIIKQEEQIVDFEKYELVSPISTNIIDFIDLKRFSLKPGDYQIEIEIIDQLDVENSFKKNIAYQVVPYPTELKISELQLLHRVEQSVDNKNVFFKFGNIMEPAAYNFFHKGMKQLFIYAEVYNTALAFTDDFAIGFRLINEDSNKDVLKKYKKHKANKQLIYIQKIPIESLPSGNYKIVLELIDKTNTVFKQKEISFQRSNPSMDLEAIIEDDDRFTNSFIMQLSEEELIYNLKALVPIVSNEESVVLLNTINSENPKAQRYFLYQFWSTFDPVNTEKTFKQYNKIAKAVDRKFYNTVGLGFETDRGYMFLKYGKPDNVITVTDEPTAPPYEIWFYDKLENTGEVNMKFLFYNPTLGGNNFELLHSTSRHERQNKQWEVTLYSDAPNDISGSGINEQTVKDSYQRRARAYFEDGN